jgi:hypothetical protein
MASVGSWAERLSARLLSRQALLSGCPPIGLLDGMDFKMDTNQRQALNPRPKRRALRPRHGKCFATQMISARCARDFFEVCNFPPVVKTVHVFFWRKPRAAIPLLAHTKLLLYPTTLVGPLAVGQEDLLSRAPLQMGAPSDHRRPSETPCTHKTGGPVRHSKMGWPWISGANANDWIAAVARSKPPQRNADERR